MASKTELNSEFILIVGSFGMLFLTTTVIIFIYLYQRKVIKRKLEFQKIEDLLKNQELKSTYALLEGQDLERQRIAQELHDNLGSILVTMGMYAETFLRSIQESEKSVLAEKINDIAKKANETAHQISQELDSNALKYFGFQSALSSLVEAINTINSVKIETHIELQGELNYQITFNLYRIIQELINNTLKHASASVIRIHLTEVGKEYISFIYEDNGIGITSTKPSKGLGLRSIFLRVEKLNGQISLGTENGKGFSATIEIPL
jgi:signal transduction histidine kinase